MTLEHPQVRERLIEITLRLLEQGGLEQVKARAVADLADVSVGTIYNLFESVDGLILATLSRTYDELGRFGRERAAAIEAEITREAVVPESERVRRRLLGLAIAYVDFVAVNSNRWTALLAFNRSRGHAASAANLRQLEGLIDIIGDMLAEAPSGNRPEARRKLARTLWSAVHGIVTTNFDVRNAAATRAVTTDLLEMLLTVFVRGLFAD